MAELNVGKLIAIPCDVKPGPFSGEKLVEFETVHGRVSGFVMDAELRQRGESWFVRGEVRALQDEVVEIWVRGSFFTTNGVATISRDMALAA